MKQKFVNTILNSNAQFILEKYAFVKDFTLERNGHDSLLSYVKALSNPASMYRFIYLFLRGNFCQKIFLKVL